ncbi:MAG: class I SAM-dependent DNA methyltransferase [Acidimicrobiia bacterium]
MGIEPDNEWDNYADAWDDDDAVRAYADAAFESLLPILNNTGITLERASVLDFGCGTGQLAERLAQRGAEVLAVDTSRVMLSVLDGKISEHRWSGIRTATMIPSSGVYDLVVCSSVCGFLADYPGTVQDLVSLLEPGGLFVQWDWERSDEADSFGLTRSEIQTALEGAGLTDVVVETAFTVSIEGEAMAPLIGHGRRTSPKSAE